MMSKLLPAAMVEGIVIELNDEIEDRDGLSTIYHITFTSDGATYIVNFLGEPLWNSEEDEREIDEKSEEYEPLKDFIRRKYNELIDELQLQKI